MKGVTKLPYILQLWNPHATNYHISCRDVFFLGGRNQQKKWKGNDRTTLLAWALFPNYCFSELFRTSYAPRAKAKDLLQGGWALIAHKEKFPSSIKPDTSWIPCPVQAGRGLSRIEWSVLIWHFKEIWIWYEINWMQLKLLKATVPTEVLSLEPLPQGRRMWQTCVWIMTIIWACHCWKLFIKRERLGI